MDISVWIKRILPTSQVRNAFRVAAYLPADTLELLAGKRKTPIPPRGMRFDSAESYAHMGKVGVHSLERFCCLRDVLCWLAASGLKPTIMYGSWAGKKSCHGLHDDIVVEKIQ